MTMIVSKKKQEELTLRMQKLAIAEADLIEKFILGRGPGGQKVNKTSSAVYLLHRPTGIEIKASRERSLETNRFLARRLLCERLEKALFGIKTLKEREQEKIRKQKKRRARRHQQTEPPHL